MGSKRPLGSNSRGEKLLAGGSVEVDRTELEWNYEPTDFFEAPYSHTEPDFEVKIDDGTATATLTALSDVPEYLEGQVRSFVEGLFSVRELQLHRSYNKLEGPRIVRYSGSSKSVPLGIADSLHVHRSDQLDFKVHDTAGNLVRDSKAERIAAALL